MLKEFNEGRSKTYFCIAATVLEIEELKRVINQAKVKSKGLDVKTKSEILHLLIDEIGEKKNSYVLFFFNKNHQASELTVLAPENNCHICLSVNYSSTSTEKSVRFIQPYRTKLATLYELFLS